jgi:hypothetical protein
VLHSRTGRADCSRARTSAAFGEHAPWALRFRLSLRHRAVSADIFDTCFKNGLLPVALTEAEVDRLFHESAAFRLVIVDLGADGVECATASAMLTSTCSANAAERADERARRRHATRSAPTRTAGAQQPGCPVIP